MNKTEKHLKPHSVKLIFTIALGSVVLIFIFAACILEVRETSGRSLIRKDREMLEVITIGINEYHKKYRKYPETGAELVEYFTSDTGSHWPRSLSDAWGRGGNIKIKS